jgi:hypothetical protein
MTEASSAAAEVRSTLVAIHEVVHDAVDYKYFILTETDYVILYKGETTLCLASLLNYT